ncbi:MAG: Flp pilus assembly complex ATPase component TadA [Candidatus Omnitrophica bacterium]|nr:Flp pilus assembly complex ATPase component TadA [Candidatus Omnitrophota bacterium]
MKEVLSNKMLEMMVNQGLLKAERLERARKVCPPDESLTECLLDHEWISSESYLSFLSDFFRYPIVDVSSISVPADLLSLIPTGFAQRHGVLPISRANGAITVAIINPADVLLLDDLRSITDSTVSPVIALPKVIRQAIDRCYSEVSIGNESMQELIDEATEKQNDSGKSSSELIRLATETPVIKITNALLTEAVRRKASDLFIEPWEKKLHVRCRIDGLLEDIKAPPKSMAEALVSRIKVVSNLNIAEHRIPQDGRFRIKALDRMIDIRVSIIPTSFGEKVCLRILDTSTHQQDLKGLGFHPRELERIEQCARRPYGMILVTGPTGSGKSTTLYSILQHLHDETKNITTVEDPVEYKVEGVNQVQSNDYVGLTFSAALRSILRQDPDIIMIGEIRDVETLDIAIKAALTGHLVLSTLHTNDAASSIIRMTNMGIEPFLITSSVLMVSAQRLVRRLCHHCRETYTPPEKLIIDFRLPKDRKYTFYKPAGCALCRRTGFAGRSVITEVLLLTPKINDLIVKQETADVIKATARKEGMTTLRESVIRKVVHGETSVEEVYRVTMPDPDTGTLLEI